MLLFSYHNDFLYRKQLLCHRKRAHIIQVSVIAHLRFIFNPYFGDSDGQCLGNGTTCVLWERLRFSCVNVNNILKDGWHGIASVV